MSAKPSDTNDPFKPEPPCFVPKDEARAAVQEAKHGVASTLLKVAAAAFTLSLPFAVGWAVWVTQRITEIEKSAAIVNRITEQIAINTPIIHRHDREIVQTNERVASLAKELMPIEQRVKMFVTRAEWELVIKGTEREFEHVKAALRDVNMKLDRLLANRNGDN